MDATPAQSYRPYNPAVDGPIGDKRCAITWADGTDIENPVITESCKHVFAERAFQEALTRKAECPMCRRAVRRIQSCREILADRAREAASALPFLAGGVMGGTLGQAALSAGLPVTIAAALPGAVLYLGSRPVSRLINRIGEASERALQHVMNFAGTAAILYLSYIVLPDPSITPSILGGLVLYAGIKKNQSHG